MNIVDLLNLPPRDRGGYDFHTHTCWSDGDPDHTPEVLCRRAVEAGLTCFAITDHNYMIPEALRLALCAQYGLDIVSGCEVHSTWYDKETKTEWILHHGRHYGTADDPDIREVLAINQAQDFEGYVKEQLHRLKKYCGVDPSHEGVDRSFEMIRKDNPRAHEMGKRCIIALLIKTGYASSRDEARVKYWDGDGRHRGIAYVPAGNFLRFAPTEQVMYASTRNSLSTFNHPYYYRMPDEVLHRAYRELAGMGCHAVEVFYPFYNENQQRMLMQHCVEYGFLPSGGSDSHDLTKPLHRVPEEALILLQRRLLEQYGTLTGGRILVNG